MTQLMGKIPQELIDQILDRVNIVEVISDYVHLKKNGRNFKTNCPFHDEKTPSFVVSSEKQIYHCFGCGAGGNAIGFVMKHENLNFPEAVSLLAKIAGVELPHFENSDGQTDSIAAKVYEINKIAAGFYRAFLKSEKGQKAREYLSARSIKPETLNEFQIGYAPEAWDGFKKYCTQKKISLEFAQKAGLLVTGEKSSYDRFRKRIIFPVFNEKGNIVAFGGRVMDKSLPKYINSPETPVYTKSNILFGLNFCKKGIRENKYVLIVEGYMDVIIPFQYGINNIVATSGTALTERQVSMLKRYTKTAVMIFDADQAGEAASLRGLDILIENDMNVRIVTLPKGDDPDSFIKKNGTEAFKDVIKNAVGLFEYKLAFLIRKFGINNIGAISGEMLQTIIKVNNAVIQSDYLKKLAERLEVNEGALRQEMVKIKQGRFRKYEAVELTTGIDPKNYRGSEVHLLGLACAEKKVFEKVRDEFGLETFLDESVKKAIQVVADFLEDGKNEITPGKLLARLEGDENAKGALIEAFLKADITLEPLKAADDCIHHIRKENLKIRLKVLTDRLKKAQEVSDTGRMKELLEKINILHKKKVN